MPKELDDFSCLFDLTPNIDILNLTNHCDIITKALHNLLKPVGGNLTTIETSAVVELKSNIKRSNYDYGIICDSFINSTNKNMLIKIITMAIRDSGYIIILEKKDKALDDIYVLLEEFDYGAISMIDIFSEYNLIMGKKLHMWGMD